MVIFLYNLYNSVLIQHGCLANSVFALEPSYCVRKRLPYIITVSVSDSFPLSAFSLSFVFTMYFFLFLSYKAPNKRGYPHNIFLIAA